MSWQLMPTSILCQSVVTLLRYGYRGRVCVATTRKMVTFVSAIQYESQGGEGVGSWMSWTSLV
jgi:hypothetical protein